MPEGNSTLDFHRETREIPCVAVTRIFLISQNRLLRESIEIIVSRCAGMKVIGSVGGVDDPSRMMVEQPDIVVLDAATNNSVALARQLRRLVIGLRIVVFAISDKKEDICAWAAVRINGCVAREGSSTDLMTAIESSLRGEVFCSARLTGLLLAHVVDFSGRLAPAEVTGVLTPRELEIMDFVEQGLPNKDIARQLGIGPATVKNHIHRILILGWQS